MRQYKIKEHPGKGIIRVFSAWYGLQIWALSNKPVRKNHTCNYGCGKTIVRGEDKAYRPIANTLNRGDRICSDCGKGAES